MRNHALVDGIEGLAWSASCVFHLINGRDLTYTIDAAELMMLSATAAAMDVPDIAVWRSDHSAS